ncbi:MAG: helix-turn-helix transcriptional regulator [Fibrobacteres bacterium]|nr:helix-turn-helix transcriptional regulator [Fibrobacterota bacterium]
MLLQPKILEPSDWLDALVSRRYNFRFTAFGHTKDGEQLNIGPRSIPDHHFTYYSLGETRSIINKQTIILKHPEIMWIQPGILHHFSPLPNSKHTMFWLRFFLGEDEIPFALSFPFMHTNKLNGIPGMINDILPIVGIEESSSIFRARCLLANMLGYVLSETAESNNDIPGLTERQKRHSLEFITKNIRRRPTTAEIANAIGLSADYFSRMFTRTFNMPVQTFLKRERIKFACQILLESDRSVSSTAEILGFPDIYYFSHQFKEITGLSPRSWRESKRIPRR